MIRRLLFVCFLLLGGWLFYIPKWILVGTRASRERREILRELKRGNTRSSHHSAAVPEYRPSTATRLMTEAGDWVDRKVRPRRSS